MVRVCAYPGCFNQMKSRCLWRSRSVTFHKLPVQDPERLTLWLTALGKDVETACVDSLRVCSKHFSKDDFRMCKGRPLLKTTAVPSVVQVKTEICEDCVESSTSADVPLHERDRPAVTKILKENISGGQCCVKNCSGRSHDHLGRKIPNGLTFHCFPAWRMCEGASISELTMRRRAAWVAAVDRACISFSRIPKSMRVCSRHFHSGKPAYEMLESDPDWVPSLELGHGPANRRLSKRLLESSERRTSKKTKKKTSKKTKKKTSKKTKKIPRKMSLSALRSPQSQPESGGQRSHSHQGEAVGGTRMSELEVTSQQSWVSAHDYSWREAKSQLHAVLNPTPSTSTLDGEAKHAGKEEAFRSFFREFLWASLEASRRSSHSRESSLRSSESEGCEQQQMTITVLQDELTQRSVGQMDTDVSTGLNSSPVPPEEAPLSPDTEEVPDWAEPFEEEEEEEEEKKEEEGGGPDNESNHPDNSSPSASRLNVRLFRTQWLQEYWFLRYSEKRGVMWCEVCHVHQDRKAPQHGMINGTGCFKLDVIKKHMNGRTHLVNLELYGTAMEAAKKANPT